MLSIGKQAEKLKLSLTDYYSLLNYDCLVHMKVKQAASAEFGESSFKIHLFEDRMSRVEDSLRK